jgi:hypothetical protein
MFFHVDSGKLSSVLQHLRDGRTIDGEDLGKPLDLRSGRGSSRCGAKNCPSRVYSMEDHEDDGRRLFPDHADFRSGAVRKIHASGQRLWACR